MRRFGDLIQFPVDDAVALEARGDLVCARRAVGGLICAREKWVAELEAESIAGIGEMAEVVQGKDLSCAQSVDGEVWCWGIGGPAQLTMTPRRVEGLGGVVDLGVDGERVCAAQVDGTVVCWRPRIDSTLERIAGIADAVEVTVSYETVCARQTAGTVVCNEAPHCQGGPAAVHRVEGVEHAIALRSGSSLWCAIEQIDDTRELACWGRGKDEFGPSGCEPPMLRFASPSLVDVALGFRWMCVDEGDSRGPWCWGAGVPQRSTFTTAKVPEYDADAPQTFFPFEALSSRPDGA